MLVSHWRGWSIVRIIFYLMIPWTESVDCSGPACDDCQSSWEQVCIQLLVRCSGRCLLVTSLRTLTDSLHQWWRHDDGENCSDAAVQTSSDQPGSEERKQNYYCYRKQMTDLSSSFLSLVSEMLIHWGLTKNRVVIFRHGYSKMIRFKIIKKI